MAGLIGAKILRSAVSVGRDDPIQTAAPLEACDFSAIAFWDGDRNRFGSGPPPEGVVLCAPDDVDEVPSAARAVLGAPQPKAAFARAITVLHQPRPLGAGPFVSPLAQLEDGVRLEPGAVIGADAEIGADTVIGAGAIVGPGVAIGRGCRIGANASLACALLGDRVVIGPGAVIGANGFHIAASDAGQVALEHLGRVVIQDDTTIGANSCIDRGLFGDTEIGERVHIDNLCQVGHNSQIGAGAILAGAVGVSGSCRIGPGARLAGGAGLADHAEVGAGAEVGARAVVVKAVPPGETWMGAPARPKARHFRELAVLAALARRVPGRKTS
ncbi:MAG: UDP-3-O-(3-hydroxymyristoyl)glucosamine N-acyltransferase [Maricaulaceae bacterium]